MVKYIEVFIDNESAGFISISNIYIFNVNRIKNLCGDSVFVVSAYELDEFENVDFENNISGWVVSNWFFDREQAEEFLKSLINKINS